MLLFTLNSRLSALLLFFLCQNYFLQAQTRYYAGATAAGFGNASVTVADEWSVFNNIGTLASYNKTALAVGFDNRFSVVGLNTLTAGFSAPLSFVQNAGVIGASVLRFGDHIFNEQMIGLGYSHKIQGVSLGVKANYVQTAIEGLGTRGTFTFEFGGAAQLTKNLFMGMHIYNFTQAKLTANEESRIPSVMKAGLSYRPSGDRLMLNAEIEKEGDREARAKFGVAYEFTPGLTVRTGVSTAPFRGCFGFGWRFKNMGFDYAINTHQTLNMSHHVAFVYYFGKNDEKQK
jgi:hypothetical protein